MRKTIFIILSIIIYNSLRAQSDTSNIGPVEIPNSNYAVYQYNPAIQEFALTYIYSNLWDIDNDGVFDSIKFIGNGGAHTYFHFELKLSSKDQWFSYPTFQIDMPYYNENSTIDEITQFAVFDYDKDGINEIYLNIDNQFGSVPKKLKKKGLTSKQILIEVENGILIVKNFENK